MFQCRTLKEQLMFLSHSRIGFRWCSYILRSLTGFFAAERLIALYGEEFDVFPESFGGWDFFLT